MKKTIKILCYTLPLLFIVFCVLIYRPVPIVSEAEAIVTEGTVTDIHEGGVKDVVFRLKNDDRVFYINRGLENGLKLATLKQQLIGQNVTFKYPDHWSLLNPKKQSIHLSKVVYNNQVIFNELSP